MRVEAPSFPEEIPTQARALSEIPKPIPSSPDDLRAQGWRVAVHNDYRQNGRLFTFWLLTMGDRCVKGEGETDAEALDAIREQLGR